MQGDSEVSVGGTSEVDGTLKNTRKPSSTFEYDRVFGPHSTQLDVFNEVRTPGFARAAPGDCVPRHSRGPSPWSVHCAGGAHCCPRALTPTLVCAL